MQNIQTFHAPVLPCAATCYLHIHEQKQHFIAYKSVSLFSLRSVYTQSFEHLNIVGIRATMDSRLEEQRSVIKLLLSEDEKPFHLFLRLQKSFF